MSPHRAQAQSGPVVSDPRAGQKTIWTRLPSRLGTGFMLVISMVSFYRRRPLR
jgi:hypothetical protein